MMLAHGEWNVNSRLSRRDVRRLAMVKLGSGGPRPYQGEKIIQTAVPQRAKNQTVESQTSASSRFIGGAA
jgi:hypothetical protein